MATNYQKAKKTQVRTVSYVLTILAVVGVIVIGTVVRLSSETSSYTANEITRKCKGMASTTTDLPIYDLQVSTR